MEVKRAEACYAADHDLDAAPPLMLLAIVAALLLLAFLLCRPVSVPRLVAEAVITALGITAVFWLGWVVMGLIEHR